MRTRNLNQVLCFVRTKHGTSRLARQLAKDGLVTDAIHGDKTQQARMEAGRIRQANLFSRSLGKEPKRRVRVYATEAG